MHSGNPTSTPQSHLMPHALLSQKLSTPTVKHVMKAVSGVLTTTALLLAQWCHAGGLVFSDGFEQGNTALWQQDDYHNKCIAVSKAMDSGIPHSGSYMAQCSWNGVVVWNDPAALQNMVLPNWSYRKEFLIRMWVRLDQDFGTNCGGCIQVGEGAKLLRLNFVNDDYATFMMQGGGSHEQWFHDGSLFLNFYGGDNGPAGAFLDRRWHKVEIYIYQDATTGIVKRWQDGQLMYTYTGRTSDSAGAPYYPMYVGSNWSNNPGWQHSANNHFYVDDVEIFSDLGTIALSGTMLDATITTGTAPTRLPAPTNLRVLSISN